MTNIDWSKIPAEYQWAAMDLSGKWYAFIDGPYKGETIWNLNDDGKIKLWQIEASPAPDWTTSLQKRPEEKMYKSCKRCGCDTSTIIVCEDAPVTYTIVCGNSNCKYETKEHTSREEAEQEWEAPMDDKIELKVGQVWENIERNARREIIAVHYEQVAYKYHDVHGAYNMCVSSVVDFIELYVHKLVASLEFPKKKKTVKKAQAVVRAKGTNIDEMTEYLFASMNDAVENYRHTIMQVIQWPLIVNGVEQWIEVEE